MKNHATHEITALLDAWGNGEQAALATLMPMVYAELHQMAHRQMQREPAGHLLQTSALVNEAYLKLAGEKEMRWKNRAHFFAVASQMMRQILVDYARTRCAEKRGGGMALLPLDEALKIAEEGLEEFLVLDEALNQLAAFDQRKSRVAMLRFFGGLTVEEIAEALGVSPITVMREWRLARAWLHNHLTAPAMCSA